MKNFHLLPSIDIGRGTGCVFITLSWLGFSTGIMRVNNPFYNPKNDVESDELEEDYDED